MITGCFEGVEAAWERAAPTVVQRLKRRGVSASDAEDAVQDAAVRALTSGVMFESEDHVRRWLTLVAWRSAIDVYRRWDRNADCLTDFVGTAGVEDDPSVIVEMRIAAEAVLTAVGKMRESDRSALLDAPPVNADRTTAIRLNVRRHRARVRLLGMVEGVLSWWLWVRIAFRRPRAAAAVAGPMLIVLVVVVTPHWVPDGSERAEESFAASEAPTMQTAPQLMRRDEVPLAPLPGVSPGVVGFEGLIWPVSRIEASSSKGSAAI